MQKIRRIMCCCGNGLGSSMFVKMNVENVLSDMGKENITLFHSSITDVDPFRADLFIAGTDVAPVLKSYPRVVILNDLISYDEAREKLEKAFENENTEFFII